ncbi:hypothetical protein UFOVP1040_63 [uncultured Caudovirales phage]|uniref:Uncharacterized protein n=1 Tax=uncultured Caudovirales phage TaxID=2100421 RepID=A0A6J5QLQ3_9CAUD|nr:hypothetical protein UFOVP1040_63 [uncultured Caudovirales phage]
MEQEFVDRRTEQWHVGKEIPLALMFTLVIQTGGMVWWAATLSQKVDNLNERVAALSLSQFTSIEARGLVAMNGAKQGEQDRRLTTVEERLRELEARLRK